MSAEFTPQKFAELSDVDVSEVADGDVFVWNATAGKLLPAALGAAAGVAFVQDSDPGAVGPGALWVNTALSVGQPADVLPLNVRNAANDGWLAQGLAYYVDGQVRSFVTVGDGGVVAEVFDAEMTPVGGLAIYGDGSGAGAAILRFGSNYMHFQHGRLYFFMPDGTDFWFNNPLNNDVWGVSDPSGAEAFGALATPPTEAEVTDAGLGKRIHWYDGTSGEPALRYMQADESGTITTGKSAGLSDDGAEFKGVVKQTLDPATCTPEDIANALIALGLAVAP